MKIKKDELRNLFIIDVIIWIITITIMKYHNPQLSSLRGLISAIIKRDIVAVFYICGILMFIMISYITFFCGLYIVYDESIGKIVRTVKNLLGKHENRNYCIDDIECYYTKVDILIIAICVFLILPTALYLVFPALTAVMGGIFILYCFLKILR